MVGDSNNGSETVAHGLPEPGPAGDSGQSNGLRQGGEPAPLRIDTRPALSPAQAQVAVRTQLGAAGLVFGTEELVILPRTLAVPARTGPGLNAASMFQITSGHDLAWLLPAARGSDAWACFVDAHSGAILQVLPGKRRYVPAQAVGNTLFNGRVALDAARGDDGRFALLDLTRGKGGPFGGNAILEAQHQTFAGVPPLYLQPAELGNVWGDGRPEATVVVRGVDLDGDGSSAWDFQDLALMADAWGAAEAPVQADFNGDGRVDDLDLTLFLARFGGAL
jgi:hypothetical protein